MCSIQAKFRFNVLSAVFALFDATVQARYVAPRTVVKQVTNVTMKAANAQRQYQTLKKINKST